jgi:hypothetical protein
MWVKLKTAELQYRLKPHDVAFTIMIRSRIMINLLPGKGAGSIAIASALRIS